MREELQRNQKASFKNTLILKKLPPRERVLNKLRSPKVKK